MNEADDGSLVQAILRRRDQRAFAVLYERHTPVMYGLALRLAAGVDPEAEDVVHDAWVRAVERLETFEWRSPLQSWLCGFVVRRWKEVRRERGRGNGDSADYSRAASDTRLEATVERIDLERAVRRLGDGQREVLLLHDVNGLTHREIAALLEIEVGTSKSQLSRARHALRQSLSESGGVS